jgi:hypothetical protein
VEGGGKKNGYEEFVKRRKEEIWEKEIRTIDFSVH